MDLRKLSTIVDSIGSNSAIDEIKKLLTSALKSESGTVLKDKINGVEVIAEKEEGSDWDPDFGNLDYAEAKKIINERGYKLVYVCDYGQIFDTPDEPFKRLYKGIVS